MTDSGVSRVTSVSYDEFVEQFVNEGLDASLDKVLADLGHLGVHIAGELRAYYPMDSYVVYDGISERAGRILGQLLGDPRLELVAFLPSGGDQVLPAGTLELALPRRKAGPDFTFTGATPRVLSRDRRVRARLRPVQRRRWVREGQAEPGTLYVFAESTLSDEVSREAAGT